MAMPRIFVSHSSDDAAFANRLSNDLRTHGADVWLDSSHMASGDFIAHINQALQQRDVVILALSPAAIRSNWVAQEFNAAIARSHQGFMRAPLVVLARACPLADIPPMWTVYHRYDATQDYQNALNGILQALGMHGSAQGIAPGAPIVAPAHTPPPNAVTYVDALRSNTNGWGTDGRVSFKSDGLHINNLKSPSNQVSQGWTTGPGLDKFGGNLTNMTLLVSIMILRENANFGAGVHFRYQGDYFNYGFRVSSIGQWCFYKSLGPGNTVDVVPWAEHQSIRQGLNVTNTLRVSAVGSHFDFFVNDVKVGQADDATYPSGRFRLGTGFDSEAVYSGIILTVW